MSQESVQHRNLLSTAGLSSSALSSSALGSSALRSSDLLSSELGAAELRPAELHSEGLRAVELHPADFQPADFQPGALPRADFCPVDLRTSDLRIVPLGVEFADRVCALEPRCYSHPWSAALIRGEFSKEVSFRYGICCGNRLVAYCFSYLVLDELHILNLAVDPDVQGDGYGRMLLDAVLNAAISAGALTATLEVRRSNVVAQRLYQRAGFRQVGVRRSYYRDNCEDALVMNLVLNERLRVPLHPNE